MKTFLIWFKNARYAAIPQSLLPALVAVAFASKSATFSPFLAFISVIGVIFAHLGSNLLDDYFDARKNDSSYKDRLASKGIRSRIAKCSYLTDGSATMKQLKTAAFLFSAFALFLGALIVFFRIDQLKSILIIVGITAFIGVFYSAWPFRLSYKGLGEFCIALLFGPLLMQGVYIASSGTIDFSLFFISIPIGILVANIVYTHAILDFEPDKMIQKKTLAVALNNKQWMNFFSFFFLFLPFIIVLAGIIFHVISSIFLLTFLTLPLSIWLFISILDFQKNPSHIPEKKWFHFPMEQWKEVNQAGIGWFMIRWYTARNIIILFCLICSIIALSL
jgi:1,4-dihydroxy-2-naphthoate octaprenyltransferase